MEYTGWILDIYPHPERGIVLWLVCDDGQRRCLVQEFPVTFYAAGPSHRLRELWSVLGKENPPVRRAREERRDLFLGTTVVLAATLESPAALPALFQKLNKFFPDLTFYDVDLHVALRHAAVYSTFPLARCHIVANEQNTIRELNVLDSRWDIDPELPPLRVLTMEPDTDPLHSPPKKVLVRSARNTLTFDIENDRTMLGFLGHLLKQDDPDLIVTSYGDTYLLPLLLRRAEEKDHPLPFNRDPNGKVGYRKERSYFAYNQVVYRGRQVHLEGRLHLDIHNTVMYHDYGIDGVLEMARVTSLPVQVAARVSPGTGISAMQVVKALENEILVPLTKEQVENVKTTSEMFESDKGGMVYDPIIGLHDDVAEVDFFSMYPSIMVRFNISPETVGRRKLTPAMADNLEEIANHRTPGLIPQTLAPLLEKRFLLKNQLLTLSRLDCRYKNYKAQAAAHKWLLVTCFGYLGFVNARFGLIEAHEAVTAYGREILLRAKEAAEDLGFRVLHLYVDGMWVRKPGCRTVQDFGPLLEEIEARTSLPVALDGVYRWIAFLSARRHKEIPVPNRYFGAFQNGEIKTRGIETRRHDTPVFIREAQIQILEILARAPDVERLQACLPEIRAFLHEKQAALASGGVPPEHLIVHQTVSRTLDEFKSPSAVATALRQMKETGKSLRPGQTIRLIYTLGMPRVQAWDSETPFDPCTIDLPRYRRLLERAVDTVLEPITGNDTFWRMGSRQLAYDTFYTSR
jgi:DNA polymerase II